MCFRNLLALSYECMYVCMSVYMNAQYMYTIHVARIDAHFAVWMNIRH